MAIKWSIGISRRRSVIYSILSVEGKPALRIELVSALPGDTFKVTDTSDYFEALWRLDESKHDLAIVNVELPLIDSWEACY